MKDKEITIQLVKSPIGYHPRIRATAKALGFKKLNQKKKHILTPQIQGMINKINFLVRIVEEK